MAPALKTDGVREPPGGHFENGSGRVKTDEFAISSDSHLRNGLHGVAPHAVSTGPRDQVQELGPGTLSILAMVGVIATIGLTVAQASSATAACGNYWIVLGVGVALLIGGLLAGKFGQIFVLVFVGAIGVLLMAIGGAGLFANSCSIPGL